MKTADFARLCYLYINASDNQKQAALALMTENEQNIFLTGVSYFKIMTDKEYHDKIMMETLKQYISQLEGEKET